MDLIMIDRQLYEIGLTHNGRPAVYHVGKRVVLGRHIDGSVFDEATCTVDSKMVVILATPVEDWLWRGDMWWYRASRLYSVYLWEMQDDVDCSSSTMFMRDQEIGDLEKTLPERLCRIVHWLAEGYCKHVAHHYCSGASYPRRKP